MRFADQFFVIDPEHSRRARLTYDLTQLGFRAEPFHDPSELSGRWPHKAAVMVSNVDHGPSRLFSAMKRAERLYPVLAYSERPDPNEIVDAVLEGALDYLEWPFTIGVLAEHIAILESRFEKHGFARLKEMRARDRLAALSPRERQVLDALVEGSTNKNIAETLEISHRTVEMHRANMMRKVQARSITELVKLAYDSGEERGDWRKS